MHILKNTEMIEVLRKYINANEGVNIVGKSDELIKAFTEHAKAVCKDSLEESFEAHQHLALNAKFLDGAPEDVKNSILGILNVTYALGCMGILKAIGMLSEDFLKQVATLSGELLTDLKNQDESKMDPEQAAEIVGVLQGLGVAPLLLGIIIQNEDIFPGEGIKNKLEDTRAEFLVEALKGDLNLS